MTIQDIRHYRHFSDAIATSGQPEEHEFKLIAQAGYSAVINLAMPNSDYAIPEEGNIVTAHRMSYVHIPVPFDAPAIAHLNEFINILQVYRDKKIWVHCALNYRVTAFLYHYQNLVLDVPAAQARQILFPSWQPDAVWQAFIEISPESLWQQLKLK